MQTFYRTISQSNKNYKFTKNTNKICPKRSMRQYILVRHFQIKFFDYKTYSIIRIRNHSKSWHSHTKLKQDIIVTDMTKKYKIWIYVFPTPCTLLYIFYKTAEYKCLWKKW